MVVETRFGPSLLSLIACLSLLGCLILDLFVFLLPFLSLYTLQPRSKIHMHRLLVRVCLQAGLSQLAPNATLLDA